MENEEGEKMKLWEKGYKLSKEAEDYTVGNDYILDKKLVKYDCIASIAHAKMLGKIGVLNTAEVKKLEKALNEIIKLDGKQKFIIKKEDEDCHTAIENYLTKKLGSTGKKIHTGRSRNDQVATALRLYYKDELKNTKELSEGFIKALQSFNKKYGSIAVPGYTHTRKAMPSTIKLWSAAFVDSMTDNLSLLESALKLIDQSPLGTGAGYGVPLEIDRKYTAKLLGFSKIQDNSIYVQNSRGKFESTIVHALAQIMLDLNKISTDLIIFSMPEFGYFVIPKNFSTGSSMMPQKMNPDVLELVRAKYHEVLACEFMIASVGSNTISGYNRDLQLTKGPITRSFDVAESSLSIMSALICKLQVDKKRSKEAMTKELFATGEAYKLVKKGIPFRDAYKEVGKKYT